MLAVNYYKCSIRFPETALVTINICVFRYHSSSAIYNCK